MPGSLSGSDMQAYDDNQEKAPLSIARRRSWLAITPQWTGIFTGLPSLVIILRKPTTLMSVPARLKTGSALALLALKATQGAQLGAGERMDSRISARGRRAVADERLGFCTADCT